MTTGSTRRAIGITMAVSMFHAVLAPVAAEAMTVRRATVEREKATTAFVEVFSTVRGRGVQRFEGTAIAGAFVSSVKATRNQPGVLDSLRAKVERLKAKKGPRWRGLDMTSIVIDALEAPTAAEYHERIAQLPLKVVQRIGHDEFGRVVSVIEVSHKGQLRLRIQRVIGPLAQTMSGVGASLASDTEHANADGLPLETEDGAAGLGTPVWSAAEECTMDDYLTGSGTATGECATSNELADAAAVLTASEIEVNGLQAEAQTDYSTWDNACFNYDENYDCEGYWVVEHLAAADATASGGEVDGGDAPAMAESTADARDSVLDGLLTPIENAGTPASQAEAACSWSIFMLSNSVAGWIGSFGILATVAAAATPVGWVVAGAVVLHYAAMGAVIDGALSVRDRCRAK